MECPQISETADAFCSFCQGNGCFPEVSNCLLIFQHVKSIIIIVSDMCWLSQGLRKTKTSRSAILNLVYDSGGFPALDPNFSVGTRQEHPGLSIILCRTNSLGRFNSV